MKLLLAILWGILIAQEAVSKATDPLIFLYRHGYLDLVKGQSLKISFTDAVSKFQTFSSIPVTGKLDKATLKQMQGKRCGVPHATTVAYSGSRSYSKWNKYRLTYKFLNYSPDMPRDDIRRLMVAAFKIWSDVTPLTFVLVDSSSKADIDIGFYRGDHGDPFRFDGRGRDLAHTTYSPNGDIHFDEDETFSANPTGDETDFYFVAAHEIGHALGLRHTSNPRALMYGPYQPQAFPRNFQLPSADITAIQAIYGDQNTIPTSPPVTKKPCFDRDSSCAASKRSGYCASAKPLMKQYCAKTCSFCS